MAADLERLSVVLEAETADFDRKMAEASGRIRTQLTIVTRETSRMAGEAEKGFRRLGDAAVAQEPRLARFRGGLGSIGAGIGDLVRDLASGGTSIGSIAASIASSFPGIGLAVGAAVATLPPLIAALGDASVAAKGLDGSSDELEASLAALKAAAAGADDAITGFGSAMAALAAVQATAAIDNLREQIRAMTDAATVTIDLPEAGAVGGPAETTIAGWARLRSAIGEVGKQAQLTQDQAERLEAALQALAAAPMSQLAGKAQDVLRTVAGIGQQAGGLNPVLEDVVARVKAAAENAAAMSSATDGATAAAGRLAESWQTVLANAQAASMAAGRALAAIERARQAQEAINNSKPVSDTRTAGGIDSYPLDGVVGGTSTIDRDYPVLHPGTPAPAPSGGGGGRGTSSLPSRADSEEAVRRQQAIRDSIDQVTAAQRRVAEENAKVADAFADLFVSAIDGSESLQDSLKNLASQLAQIFLSRAFQQIFGGGASTAGGTGFGSFGGMPGGTSAPSGGSSGDATMEWIRLALQFGSMFLAKGGRAEKGRPYVIGEKGAELFVPDQSGTVVPHSKIQIVRAEDGSVKHSGGIPTMFAGGSVPGVHVHVEQPHQQVGSTPYTAPEDAVSAALLAALGRLAGGKEGGDGSVINLDLRAMITTLASIADALQAIRIPQHRGQPIRFPKIAAGGHHVAAGVYHVGGIVGHHGTSRFVPASVFESAPRYHVGGVAGLKPGEVPSVLQAGELIIPKAIANRAATRSAPRETVNLFYQPNVDAKGADPAAIARLEQQQRALAASFKDQVHAAIADPRNRGRAK